MTGQLLDVKVSTDGVETAAASAIQALLNTSRVDAIGGLLLAAYSLIHPTQPVDRNLMAQFLLEASEFVSLWPSSITEDEINAHLFGTKQAN